MGERLRVLRVFHAGREAAHRERDEALARAGVSVTLAVPSRWPGADEVTFESRVEIVELPVHRPGDVNRHRYVHPAAFAHLVRRVDPDLVDLHEEPFSSVAHQLLSAIPETVPVVAYTAQNIDKRFPPPFAQWERQAFARVAGIWPCTQQAASVVVGKGFRGVVRVLPLGTSASMQPGSQDPPGDVLAMLLVGRFVPEKGVLDAVRVLAEVRRHRSATLELIGAGPQAEAAAALGAELGVADALVIRPWMSATQLAERYRCAHVLLAPSTATRTWVEQFGRMVVEAHACGTVVAGYASGSLPEVVHRAGVLVPEGDAAALGTAVLEVAAEPARWRELRDLGLADARHRTWDAIAADQLHFYREAIDAHDCPRPVRPQRRQAVQRFGEPARIAGGGRPFALPILRENTALTRALARVVDALGPRDQAGSVDGRLRAVYVTGLAPAADHMAVAIKAERGPDGVDTHVICDEGGPLLAEIKDQGASVEVLKFRPSTRDSRRQGKITSAARVAGTTGRTVVYALRLARRLRELRPDTVDTGSLAAGDPANLAARLARVPVTRQLRHADTPVSGVTPHA